MEIYYFYVPSRDYQQTPALTKLDPLQVVEPITDPVNPTQLFGGLYNLKLPASVFNQKGFYYLVVRPKRINATIVDVGVLADMPTMVGIIFDINQVASEDKPKFVNGGLSGFRVEYINDLNQLIPNFFRLVTSSNLAEPINSNLSSATAKGVRYRFNDQGTLLFCQLSPSSPSSVKQNILPYIGKQQQKVVLTNTYFDPIMIEVEMAAHDADTLAIGLFGNQIKRNIDGLWTLYDANNNIYKQYNLLEYQNGANQSLYEIKKLRDITDFTADFNTIINQTQ